MLFDLRVRSKQHLCKLRTICKLYFLCESDECKLLARLILNVWLVHRRRVPLPLVKDPVQLEASCAPRAFFRIRILAVGAVLTPTVVQLKAGVAAATLMMTSSLLLLKRLAVLAFTNIAKASVVLIQVVAVVATATLMMISSLLLLKGLAVFALTSVPKASFALVQVVTVFAAATLMMISSLPLLKVLAVLAPTNIPEAF